jgi:ABC-type branched-subunit amino acid transport system substrate-binding protein
MSSTRKWAIQLVFLLLAAFLHGEQQLVVGMSLPLQGPEAHVGINLHAGALLRITQYNAEKSPENPRIKLISYNDGGNPTEAIKNIVSLVEFDEAQWLLNCYSAAVVIRLLPLIRKYESSPYGPVHLAYPLDGSTLSYADPYTDRVHHLFPTYREQCQAVVERIAKQKNNPKFAIAYQREADGRSAWDALRREVAPFGGSIKKEATFKRGARYEDDFSLQVAMLQEAKADALVLCGPCDPIAGLVAQLYEGKCETPIIWLGSIGRETIISRLEHRVPREWIRKMLLFVEGVPSLSDAEQIETTPYKEAVAKYGAQLTVAEEADPTVHPYIISSLGYYGFQSADAVIAHLIGKKMEREEESIFFLSYDGEKFTEI